MTKAAIFLCLLEEKYGLKDARIIRGTRLRKVERHFWVEVCGLLYDLTAHQFSRSRPIIGVEHHSFFASFPVRDQVVEWDFVDRNKVLRLYRRGFIPF